MAQHCAACDKCVVDFEGHSLLINNCVSGNNRPYMIMVLVSMSSFFFMLMTIAIFHFERPTQAIDGILEDFADV